MSPLLGALIWTTCAASAAAQSLPTFLYPPSSTLRERLAAAAASCGGAASLRELPLAGADETLAALDLRFGGSASEPAAAATRVLIVAGEHARELIPTELALRLVADLCAAAAARASAAAALAADVSEAWPWSPRRYAATLRALVAGARPLALTIVPLANPSGRRLVERGAYCHRGNAAGVDVNRNWGTHWLAASAATPADSLPGAAPFSEAESRALRAALARLRPHLFLTLHSGTRGIFVPPAFAADYAASGGGGEEEQDEARLAALHEIVAELGGGGGGDGSAQPPPPPPPQRFAEAAPALLAGLEPPVGGAASLLGYACPGNCLDYAFEVQRTPYAVAMEVWGSAMRAPRGETAAAAARLRRRARRAAAELAPAAALIELSRSGEGVSLGSCFGSGAARRAMTPAECLPYFNPVTREDFDETIAHWTARAARLVALIHARVGGGSVEGA